MGTVVAFLSIFLLVLALVKDLTAKRDDTGRAWRRPAALAALIFVVGVGVEVGKRHIDAEHEESEKVLQAQTKTDLLNAISQTMQAVELLSAQVAGKPNATVANIAPQLSHIRQVLQSTNDAVSTGSADRAVLRRAQESLTQIQQSISEIGNTLRERRAAETAPSGASPLEHRAPTIPSESSRVPQDLSTNRTLIGLVAAGESSSPTSGRTEGLPTTSALIAPPAPATPPSNGQNAGNPAGQQPSIEITYVPPVAGRGGDEVMAGIAGTVTGVSTVDYKVLLYADVRGTWYVQPFTNRPDTTIAPNGQWQSETHLGEQYAAILVKKASTAAQPITRELPKIGGDVVALTVVRGRNVELAPDPPVLKPATSTLGPQIFSLSPAKIAQNINQVITVSGNNFMTGFFMRLGSPDGGSTYLKPDQIHSATSSSFSFEAVLAPGTWMIHVVNPDGTLSNGFSLTVTR